MGLALLSWHSPLMGAFGLATARFIVLPIGRRWGMVMGARQSDPRGPICRLGKIPRAKRPPQRDDAPRGGTIGTRARRRTRLPRMPALAAAGGGSD